MVEREDRYLAAVYQKFPITIAKGKDALVWDVDGKEYIDCMGGYGVALVGHSNAKVIEAITKQAEKIITCHSSLYNEARAELAEKLAKLAPKGLTKTFFSNSGAEAVEAAIKVARKHTGRTQIVSMTGAYHGKTLGALSATWSPKYRDPFQPLVPDFTFSQFGNVEKLRETVSSKTAAVIVEPIQGEGGIHPAPEGFLPEVRRICNENGTLLIFDEIQTGLGRTGRMWASEHYGVVPDVMCIAKGLGGGVPIAATIAREDVMSSLKVGDHSTTFGGNPIACAAANATLDYIVKERLPDRAAEIGYSFKEKLERIKEMHPIVREVRGMGLMLGLELKFDIRNILMNGIKNGVIMLYSGRNVLRFLPPLVITREQVSRASDILDALIADEEKTKTTAS
ncbi:MAG: aspartate aminotransferase family protein [Thaumarchaeota archaeon]|nr:aspartate aminotransferase family protein [Nitrososphaerota archaeon]